MTLPLGPQPRQRRYSTRLQARLDAETRAKLGALAASFHQKRSAILRFVMQWRLRHSAGWTIDLSPPDRPHFVHMLVDPNLLQQVREAAEARGASVAAWLRHAVHRVTPEDCPPSWRAGDVAVRSHDSRYYGQRFMFRLDDETSTKLGTLSQTFHRSAADVIRQLMAQATPEDFPQSWQMAAMERRPPEARPSDRRGAGCR